MNKSLFLTSGFAITFLFSGCEKATVGPAPGSISGTQHADSPVGFYVQRNFDAHWNYQFVSTNNGIATQPCRLTFANGELTVTSGADVEGGKPVLYFSDAVEQETIVEVATNEGHVIFRKSVPVNSVAFDLSQVVLAEVDIYSLNVYSAKKPRATVYLNNYFSYKK